MLHLFHPVDRLSHCGNLNGGYLSRLHLIGENSKNNASMVARYVFRPGILFYR